MVVPSLGRLQELGEPEGRRLGVPGEPVPVVHVDEAKPLGVALGPLKVVQQGPGEVSADVNAIPARNEEEGSSQCPVVGNGPGKTGPGPPSAPI